MDEHARELFAKLTAPKDFSRGLTSVLRTMFLRGPAARVPPEPRPRGSARRYGAGSGGAVPGAACGRQQSPTQPRRAGQQRAAVRPGWPLSGSIAFHLSLITGVEWTYLLVFYFPLIISSGMGGKWKQLFIWEIYVLHLAVWFPQLYQCHLGTGIAFYIFRLQQSSFSVCCKASNNACLAVFL